MGEGGEGRGGEGEGDGRVLRVVGCGLWVGRLVGWGLAFGGEVLVVGQFGSRRVLFGFESCWFVLDAFLLDLFLFSYFSILAI